LVWDGLSSSSSSSNGGSSPLTKAIREAEHRFDTAIGATRLQVYQSESLTKEDVKASNLSPDGVMQAVLQQAHWRAHGYTAVTYESASTAAFKHGRTETIRSATAESARMCVVFGGRPGVAGLAGAGGVPCVGAELHKSTDPATRYTALRASTEMHKKISLGAVMGKGVDRHLFALSVWADRLGLPSSGEGKRLGVYADPAWAHFRDIRLSTSTLASDALDGGGFGPVNGHSYAVGYGIEERGTQFHVMSYDSSKASAVFPESEPHSARVNPTAVGYQPVDNAALLEGIQKSLEDVHDAIRKGKPLASGSKA
jgi:carnitine O-palmitoyltransferase 2